MELNFDPPLGGAPDPLEQAAAAFHAENPQIILETIKVCQLVKSRGRKRWSINGAFEVVRYNREVTSNGKTYKLNNNHRAYYARWIMQSIPELAGFFSTREQGRVAQHEDD